jgi:hypothetical protein
MRRKQGGDFVENMGDGNKGLRRTFFGNIEKRSLLKDLRR